MKSLGQFLEAGRADTAGTGISHRLLLVFFFMSHV